jgi:Tfp pilus assembly protein PilF
MLSKENGFTLPININFPESKKYFFTFVALFAALFIIYSNSFHGDWHFDDFGNIVNNPHIQIKSFSWLEIKQFLYNINQSRLWRPLPVLSFILNYKLGGMDVFGFHVVNFIIHYLTCVFLFLFIYNTLKLPRLKDQYENISYPVALLATFFWALNPVWVTCVTYIVQRYTSMAGLFYIMSMYFYLKGRTSAHLSKRSSSSILFFILCITFGLAAMLSKENAAMLPVSILLFDLFLIQGVTNENIKKCIKLSALPFLLILIIGFIYTSGFSNFLGFRDLSAGYKLRGFTMIQRLLTEPRVILFYLSLLFYPVSSRLTFLYDFEVSRSVMHPWTTIPSILLILLIIGFALYISRKRPLISFSLIFFFLNHIIEGSIFNLELIYDYRNYLPSMLLFVPFAEFIIYAVDYFSYKKLIQIIVALGIAIIIFGLGDITYGRNKIFSDDFLLWFDNIDKSPGLSRPHAMLGSIYCNYHEKEKGLQEYKKAISLNNFGGSNISLALQEYNLGLFYFTEMQDDLAMNYFMKSSKTNPEHIPNYIYMAKIKLRQNKIKEAGQIIEDKFKKYPDNSRILELYSFILLKDGKIDAAKNFAEKILAKDSDSQTALEIMAEVCRLKNNYARAIYYWKSVRELAPQNAYANLALIELYGEIKDAKMLNQEIHILLYLHGSSTLKEYIQQLNNDQKLLIYVPKLENYLFIAGKCSYIN